MTNEQIYDAEIAPKLMEIGKRCQELGFPFVASVEYEYGCTGRTKVRPGASHFKQRLIHWAVNCNGNVDSLIMAIDKYATKNGHSSVYLTRLGNKNIQYGDNEYAAIAIVSPS